MTDFDKTLALNEANANAYFFRAFAKFLNGDTVSAVDDYGKAAEYGRIQAFDSITKYNQ